MPERPVVGITMGDPVGIGPEIILTALSEPALFDVCRPLVLGDVNLLASLSPPGKPPVKIRSVQDPNAGHYRPGTLDVLSLSDLDPETLQPGRPTDETAQAMVEYIMEGIDLALSGRIQAVTTCPINKAAMHQAGMSFPGHTELFAERTGTVDYVMMLAGSKLRVALVTIHVALEEVVHRLTSEGISKTIRITHEALVNAFGITSPRLAVAALNPHGGEGGVFGNQEGGLLLPAIAEAVAAGIDASGPYPADTLFYRAVQGEWDAVICMYHDQGLIPFKMIHFTDGVNTTLGLPFVRTSVDHGTAYDIARTGKADAGSLIAAIDLAARQGTLRQNPTPRA